MTREAQLQALAKKFLIEKRSIENFLSTPAPLELLDKTKLLFHKFCQEEKEASAQPSQKQKSERKNIEQLEKELMTLKEMNYRQLLHILFRFPSRLQMGIDDETWQRMQRQEEFARAGKYLAAQDYIGKSMRLFLSDCFALYQLRKEQLRAIKRKDSERVVKAQKQLAILSHNFLLLRKLTSREGIHTYRGIDLSTSQSIFIKFATKTAKSEKVQKLIEQRFAREVKSFEQLQQHRRERISAGDREVDRYFVKVYRLAKGPLYRFTLKDGKFSRGSEEQVEFMVMKYVEGATLSEIIQEYRKKDAFLPLKVIALVLQGVLEALEYCHDQKIVHRHICPDNLWVTKELQVRFTSLGLTAIEEEGEAERRFIGSVEYTAPEGILLKRTDSLEELVAGTDQRFDLYSVGCLAYEMITGKLPFDSEEKGRRRELEILQQHLQKHAMSTRDIRPEISHNLNSFVFRLLAKKPEDRFVSASGALKALHYCFSLREKRYAEKMKQRHDLQETQETRLEDLRGVVAKRQHRRWSYVLVAIVAVLGASWYYGGEAMGKFIEEWQTKYRHNVKIEEAQRSIAQHHRELQARWQRCIELIEQLETEYPVEEGYPGPSQRVKKILQRAMGHIDDVAKIAREGENGGEQWLAQYRHYAREDQDTLAVIDGIYEKLTLTGRTAKRLKEARETERTTKKTYRLLKDYVLRVAEELALIDEKLDILQKRYPPQKGYLSVDSQIPITIAGFRRQLAQIDKVTGEVDHHIEENDFAKAVEALKPYWQFKSEHREKLQNVDEGVEETLAACAQMQKEWQRGQLLDRTVTVLQNRAGELQKSLLSARERWQEAAKIPDHNLHPDPLFERVEREIDNLQKTVLQVNKLLLENDEKGALALVGPHLQGKAGSLLPEIQALEARMADLIKIASAPKVPAVDERHIIDLLAQSRKDLARIRESYELLQKDVAFYRKEFPQRFERSNKRYIALQKQIGKGEKTLAGVVGQVEEQLKSQDLVQAQKILQQHQKQDYDVLVIALSQFRKRILDDTRKSQKLRQRQQYLSEAKRTIEKLETYVVRMNSRLSPVESQVAEMRRDFPASSGFTQIANERTAVITRGKALLDDYRSKVAAAKKLLKNKKYAKASQLLAPFALTKLGYPGLLDDLEALVNHIAEVQETVRRERSQKQRWGQAGAIVEGLREHKRKLDTLIAMLNKELQKLRPYSASDGYIAADPQIPHYINEAKMESEELQEMVGEGEKLLRDKNYREILTSLKEYKNSRFSLLPLLKTYLANCREALLENEKLRRNPQLRQHKIARVEASQNRERRLQEWRKSPGPWYQRVTDVLQEHQQNKQKISKAVRGQGNVLIYSRIELEIRKIYEFPDAMAELRELIENIRRQGKKFPNDPHDRKARLLQRYLDKQQVPVSIDGELRSLATAMQQIREELKFGGWLEEQTLRLLLRNIQSINRKFEEEYVPVKSVLINLQYQ